MTNRGKQIVKRRQKMVERFPFCYWCERFLIEYPPDAFRKGKLPDDFATIDHVYSRMNGTRPLRGVWVLCCPPCNHMRSKQEERELGKAELTRRSRMHKSARISACVIECDSDCEVGRFHCWNYHRPNHKKDWHDPVQCHARAY
jgi:hypothetical protein